ncbi:MAG TPA: UDP-N-acetylmuramate--L-alanine ligase [Thermoanaerobaculia bacterium]|nr:UDP-N-acetylmuramate--L-alanine ligase [Thermoanaerobaculia bacterium]
MNFSEIKNIHFVGIGGIGMSGIAEILSQAGVTVSGCDLKRSAATDLLTSRGIDVRFGHEPSHVDGKDLVVVTSAVRGAHAEVDAARTRGVRVMKRSEVLGAIVNAKRSIGVSGTHGKTTTSSMIAVVLEEAHLEPTILVGGMVRNLGTNAKSGAGEFLVVEADEYDRTFHYLRPEIAVVTNIEADHLEYYGSLENILEAFRIFLDGVKSTVIACTDDPAVAKLAATVQNKRVVTYGLNEGAEVRAVNLQFSERGVSFEVPHFGHFKLFTPGVHNVRNALAAIAVARELGIEHGVVTDGLARFLGVDRRFQVLGDYHGALIVDDYAHHPTEVRATLEGARKAYPNRRIVALFQPHLYSRTRDFAKEFGEALRVADVSIVAPIYAAREEPLEGISARLIADVSGVEFLDRSNSQIVNELRRRLKADDVFIAMGAGDVHEIAEQLVRGENA